MDVGQFRIPEIGAPKIAAKTSSIRSARLRSRATGSGRPGSGWFAGSVTDPSSRLPAWRRSCPLAPGDR
jgi:hypothetical protein